MDYFKITKNIDCRSALVQAFMAKNDRSRKLMQQKLLGYQLYIEHNKRE